MPAGDYTYVANRDPADQTGRISLRGGSVLIDMGQWATFTAGEYDTLIGKYDLQSGQLGLPASTLASAFGAPVFIGSTQPDRVAPYIWMKALTADVGPIASTIVLQDIAGMAVTIGASSSEMWLVEMLMMVTAANTAMDLKLGWSVPAGCTGSWGIVGGLSTEVAAWAGRVSTQTPTVGLASLAQTAAIATFAGTLGISVAALVQGGGTSGAVQARFAQNTSDAGNLSILKGSVLKATKLAA
jgi:hypothetical protein